MTTTTHLAAVADAAAESEKAAEVRDDTIRAALAAGVRAVEIAEAAGVSRGRVYQIARHGR